MKAVQAGLLGFLEKSPQLIIPIYQRTYSWTEKECRQLWEDILRAGRSEDISVHFVGSIVYIEDGISQISSRSPVLIIDGQQRVTTITLLLVALSNAIGDRRPHRDFTSSKINSRYLVDKDEEGDRHFKLILTQTDKDTLKAIVSGNELPPFKSVRLVQNFELFRQLVKASDDELEIVCLGLSKLIIVDIALSRDQDNPQLIFESMNSTGRELTQADLIRNFVLMGLEPVLQARLYTEYWRPMEVEFGQEAYSSLFDGFMRHFLTYKTGSIPKESEVYEEFKKYTLHSASISEIVQEIRLFARFYCSMALGKEQNTRLRHAFNDLRELKVDVAFPLLLELYFDYDQEVLSPEEFEIAVRLIESYVFRRAVCAIPTNSMNNTFANFMKSVRKDRYLESIKVHFLKMPSYRRFPSHEDFQANIKIRDLYHFPRRSFLFRRLENHERKERVSIDEYTIEHIIPQNENLSKAWQLDLGEDWKNVREKWLHTLGNLTLTGYNSEYGDRPFKEKRDMSGGFRDSPLKLNQGLGQILIWNENEIEKRADRLASYAVKVWGMPELPNEVLKQHLEKSSVTSIYSIDDHPRLNSTELSSLFNILRKEILALDPCVTEEFLKLYVAYKAETNFVDIVPQAKGLRLSLNTKFSDIIDPRGFCKDVTGLGRWGNGDVEVRVTSQDQIPYVMGLIRQSLELQMGTTTNGH